MVKIKPVKNKKESSHKKTKNDKSKSDIISFLKQVKNNIDKVKSSHNKKYSLLSCIFLCFFEKKKNILDKKEIYEFIKKEISRNGNKIVSSHLKSKHSEYDRITQKNYYPKVYQMLMRSKCFTKVINVELNSEEQIRLNEEHIISKKNIIYNHLFLDKIIFKKTPVKRKIRKFEKSVSAVKTQRKKTKNKIIHNDKNREKNKNENEINKDDIDINNSFSLKLKENNSKKDKDLKNCSIFMDNIKSNENKIDSIDKKKFLNQKRKSPSNVSSNDNSLVMPLFADESNNENESNENNNKINDNSEEKEELISTSLKEIKTILNKGEKFISIIKSKKFLDIVKTKDNLRKNGQVLLSYKSDSSIKNYLNIALEDYMKFSKYLEFFMNNKEESSRTKDGTDDKVKKETSIFDIKKSKCSLLISRIITKLSQFLLEYNFIIQIIKEIIDNNKNNIVLKDIIEFINTTITIISKENIEHLEKILKTELENATNFYIFNYGVCD